MKLSPITSVPSRSSYDVVIVGGAMIGSSGAWFLSANKDFVGNVLVVEKDPSYQWSSTAHTNSCMRQQFSAAVNIKIAQFAADHIKNFRNYLGGDEEIPDIILQSFGYMYLADNEDFAELLRKNQAIQQAAGAGTKIMTPAEIAAAYPFYKLDDIILGSHNRKDEGYWDGGTVFDWWRRQARRQGVEYLSNEVVSMTRTNHKIESVTLKSGETVFADHVINASGPRAVLTARMAGVDIPVEPRKRYTFVFDAETPLECDLPLTIDPSGVHVRSDGQYYMCGCPPEYDHAVDYDDFDMDHSVWEEKLWPALANRIPAFEAIKVMNAWAGHYAYNVFDHNAIIGPHPDLQNFIFVNGFSGHGLQQSPAMGRGVSELITYGAYRSLDLSELSYERIIRNEPFIETAII